MKSIKLKPELLSKFYDFLDETFLSSIKGIYPYQIFKINVRDKFYPDRNLMNITTTIDEYKTIIYSQNKVDLFEVRHFGLIKKFYHYDLNDKPILYKNFVYIKKEYSLN